MAEKIYFGIYFGILNQLESDSFVENIITVITAM